MPTGFKYAGSCLFMIIQMFAPNIQIAALLAVLCAAFFVWGTIDIVGNIRIERDAARRNSATSVNFDKQAKMVIIGVSGLLCLITALSIYGAVWYRMQFIGALEKTIYVKQHALILPDYIMSVTFDGALLSQHYTQDRAMIACRVPDARIDSLDDVNIDKSMPHDVGNGDVVIQLDISKSIVANIGPGNYQIQCTLALLPKGVSADGIKSLRQLRDLGGLVLDNFINALRKV